MEQVIERMVVSHSLATAVRVFIEVQWQTCDSLRQDADTGIHGGHLHGGTLIDVLAGGGAAEEEAVPATGCPVLGLVAGFEQAGKDAYRLDLTFFLFLDIQILDRARRKVYSLITAFLDIH